MAHEYEDCSFDRDGAVAILTLRRPERMNALSPGIREGIIQAAQETNENDDIKVLIVTGDGGNFCGGADMKENLDSFRAAEGRKGLKGPLSLPILRLYNVEKPTIAAVHGVAAGGGFGVALACDVRLASPNARFCSVFIRRGLAAEWGVSYFLPRVVGVSKAMQIMWSGEMIGADEALRLGIVEKVVPEEDLMNSALEMAHKLASGPSVSIELIKRLTQASLDNSLPAQLAWEMQAAWSATKTEDVVEGVQSFREKRPPRFKGR